MDVENKTLPEPVPADISEQVVKISAELLDKFDEEFDESVKRCVTRFGKLG